MSRDAAGNSNAGDDSRPVVYDLAPNCTLSDVSVGDRYHATVNGVVDYGVFVDVSDDVSGLIHESALGGDRYTVGDRLIVELTELKDNGDVAFAPADPTDYQTVAVEHDPSITPVDELTVGETATIQGEVVQVKQTGGPTIVHVGDETGIVGCAAFAGAGVRAYPDVSVSDVVRIRGEAESHDDAIQVEVENLDILDGETADEVRESVAEGRAERATPPEVDPLVEWDAFEEIRTELVEVARLLRETVLEGRPIRIRHHADGDGMCAAIPVKQALEAFVRDVHNSPDAARHRLKRLPSKAPFYEMEDVTRDLNFALEGRARHGQKLPFLLMLDNGSTEEDVPAYTKLSHYDVPIAVVDHHHPDPEAVNPLLDAHVNPYLHGLDYRVTTGMMCVELARLIHPDITSELRHVPAVAGLSDRSEAEAMDDYVALAAEAGYDREDLDAVGEALDYAAHWLRYDDGEQIVSDVLNVGCDDESRHEELVAFLSERAERDVERQLDAVRQHVDSKRLDSGVRFHSVDLEHFAHRFTYPAPGKTTGELHDELVREHREPVITVGYGPDFAVLRSDGVRLDIPTMVSELNEELPGAGVSGGGHLVVGSIKFVEGRREDVIDALVEKMGDAALDENLSAAAIDD
ncbi:MAG: DHH family phosphoesterase [Halobaculum sp.]